MRKYVITALLIAASVLFLSGCGEDTPVAPDPLPSSTPTPPPTVAELCEIRGTRIIFERTDKGKPNPPYVTSWPAGIVPLAHAQPVYAGVHDPTFDADKCRAFDRVRWWCTGTSSCQFIGDQTAPDIFIKVNSPGYHCARAQALDRTEFGEACFVVTG